MITRGVNAHLVQNRAHVGGKSYTRPATVQRVCHFGKQGVFTEMRRARVASRIPASFRVFAMSAETAREAIADGNSLFQEGKFPEALATFEASLKLPGTGPQQFRDKPAELSDGERATALFNIACCQSELKEERLGLVALAGCLESGFDQFELLLSDPSLATLRSSEKFPGLIALYNQDWGRKAYNLAKGIEEEESSAWQSFATGEWLWEKLTKTKMPAQGNWLKMVAKADVEGPDEK